MTNEELFKELGSNSPRNKARQKFSSWVAKIEQQASQESVSPVILRKQEFTAVDEILKAFNNE